MLKNKKVFQYALILLVLIQPLIEMDYMLYDFLDKFGLPRLSTIIKFIVIPLIIIWGFWSFDKHKKRTLIVTLIYGAALGIYFALHSVNAMAIRQDLYLPSNFYFNLFQELTYVLTMIIPYFLIYIFYEAQFKQNQIRNCILALSSVISIPILVSNLLVFSHSTYVGWTKANIFSWFTGIYDTYIPRELAGKFFFVEGNTIGIVLFMLLPILYYYFYRAHNRKNRILIGGLIVIQSLSMLILATKTATYGTVLGVVTFMGILLFCSLIMKTAKLDKVTIIFSIVMCLLMSLILPYSPAIVNLNVDAENDQAVLNDNYMIEEGKGGIEKELEGAKTKYDPALVYAFEQYGIRSNLMSTVPTMYYMEWYKYTHDAYWWLELLFNVPFYERVNGRQIQTLFIEYKMSETPNPVIDRALGLGYSTIMNGSLILERDFVQQYYSFGYLGWLLIVSPWVLITIYGAFKVLKKPKRNLRPDILVFAASLCCGLVSAYSSGHTLDEFTSSVFMAFLVAILLSMIKQKDDEHV